MSLLIVRVRRCSDLHNIMYKNLNTTQLIRLKKTYSSVSLNSFCKSKRELFGCCVTCVANSNGQREYSEKNSKVQTYSSCNDNCLPNFKTINTSMNIDRIGAEHCQKAHIQFIYPTCLHWKIAMPKLEGLHKSQQ